MRFLLAAVAASAALLANCSASCDCALEGSVDIQVAASFGQHRILLDGPGCVGAEKVRTDTWRWKIIFRSEGNCVITVQPDSSSVTPVGHTVQIVPNDDTDTCCPDGAPNRLQISPPQSGAIQFTPVG